VKKSTCHRISDNDYMYNGTIFGSMTMQRSELRNITNSVCQYLKMSHLNTVTNRSQYSYCELELNDFYSK
jgi:hypothetical protein